MVTSPVGLSAIMEDAYSFTYYELIGGRKGDTPDPVFRNWAGADERVVILSPHDDDALLGAGYMMMACLQEKAEVTVLICCDGQAGYSDPKEKEQIVAVRRIETEAAYGSLGLPTNRIVRLDIPDLSLWAHRGLVLPGKQEGLTSLFLRTLRKLRPTRLLVPNGYRENVDHTAAWYLATEEGAMVGDAVLVDEDNSADEIKPVRTFIQYSVWGDFAPEDALVMGKDARRLRANLAIVADREVEEKVEEAIGYFKSQEKIIEQLIAQRRGRFFEGRVVELYLWYDPRRPLRYQPYHARIREIG